MSPNKKFEAVHALDGAAVSLGRGSLGFGSSASAGTRFSAPTSCGSTVFPILVFRGILISLRRLASLAVGLGCLSLDGASGILVTGLTTSCGSTWFFRQFRSVFRPGLLFGSLASLAVGLILDALLFGMPGFRLLMAAFPGFRKVLCQSLLRTSHPQAFPSRMLPGSCAGPNAGGSGVRVTRRERANRSRLWIPR